LRRILVDYQETVNNIGWRELQSSKKAGINKRMAQNGSDKGKKVHHSGEIGISGKRVVFKITSGKASRIYSLLQEHGRTWQTKSAPVWRLGHNGGKTTSSPGGNWQRHSRRD
jgi:hypothetical protein